MYHIFLSNTNNLHTVVWFQVFLSDTNNLQTVVWFQVFLCNIHNYMVFAGPTVLKYLRVIISLYTAIWFQVTNTKNYDNWYIISKIIRYLWPFLIDEKS